MKKWITSLSVIIIFLFSLAVFGWMSVNISKGKKDFGALNEPIKFMYTFLDQFQQSVKEVNTLPKTFIKTPKNFKSINKLDEDVFVLTSYLENDTTNAVVVRNLRDGAIQKKWSINNKHGNTVRIFHPLYLDDGTLVYFFSYTWDALRRIDEDGKVLWEQHDLIFHHGMELNADGDIWACTKEQLAFNNGLIKIAESQHYYLDYTITKINAENGKIMFHKSISEILRENGLGNYLFKSHKLEDPLHVNDVQPALKTTEYYEKDDVFISLRTISCILHYRPSTNELINVIEGPFVSQHDVDIINDSTITVFNNNFYPGPLNGTYQKLSKKKKQKVVQIGNFYSNIVAYDLKNDKFSMVGDSIFRANKIRTNTEGIQEFMDDTTYFVEEQNSGLLWIIRDDEVIYKDVFRSQHKGHHHLPNWARIINYK